MDNLVNTLKKHIPLLLESEKYQKSKDSLTEDFKKKQQSLVKEFEEKVKAIGKEAYKMLGKTPDYLTAIRPIIDGDIYDYGALEQMLCYFIQKICFFRISISF